MRQGLALRLTSCFAPPSWVRTSLARTTSMRASSRSSSRPDDLACASAVPRSPSNVPYGPGFWVWLRAPWFCPVALMSWRPCDQVCRFAIYTHCAPIQLLSSECGETRGNEHLRLRNIVIGRQLPGPPNSKTVPAASRHCWSLRVRAAESLSNAAGKLYRANCSDRTGWLSWRADFSSAPAGR